MSPPGKKRKTTAMTTKKPKTQSTPNPSLPDDLLLSIVARVPRLYYPTLSLVSKSFRSLLASPELYKARSLLGHTESCLYVCLYSYNEYRWFTLCRKPDQTLTNDTSKKKKNSSGYVLAKVPNPHSPHASVSGLVAVGSNIYRFGGSVFRGPSSSVSIMDCRSHIWLEAPSLPVKLLSFSASVLDGKIYVAGYCKDGDSNSLKNSIEVFDTKTQMWDPEPIPCSKTKREYYEKTTCIDGKFHVVTLVSAAAYSSKEGRWDKVEGGMRYSTLLESYCEIENVLYSVFHGVIRWYDTEVRKWRELKGLVGLPKFSDGACVRLADYGGKMVVLWDKDSPCCFFREKMIWCAEIALERPKRCEIWGKVEWFDHVLTFPTKFFEFAKALAATV